MRNLLWAWQSCRAPKGPAACPGTAAQGLVTWCRWPLHSVLPLPLERPTPCERVTNYCRVHLAPICCNATPIRACFHSDHFRVQTAGSIRPFCGPDQAGRPEDSAVVALWPCNRGRSARGSGIRRGWLRRLVAHTAECREPVPAGPMPVPAGPCGTLQRSAMLPAETQMRASVLPAGSWSGQQQARKGKLSCMHIMPSFPDRPCGHSLPCFIVAASY